MTRFEFSGTDFFICCLSGCVSDSFCKFHYSKLIVTVVYYSVYQVGIKTGQANHKKDKNISQKSYTCLFFLHFYTSVKASM